MLKLGWKDCPFCQRQNIHVSRPRHVWEELAGFLLLEPVRCHDCMRRFFRPLFIAPPPEMNSDATPESAQHEVSNRKRAA